MKTKHEMMMEQVMKRAITKGWIPESNPSLKDRYFSLKLQAVMKTKGKERYFMERKFWKALFGRDEWLVAAVKFHEASLIDGFEKAVDLLLREINSHNETKA